MLQAVLVNVLEDIGVFVPSVEIKWIWLDSGKAAALFGLCPVVIGKPERKKALVKHVAFYCGFVQGFSAHFRYFR